MNTLSNANTLESLASGIRDQLTRLSDKDTDESNRTHVMNAICQLVSRACRDDEFVGRHLAERKAGEADREVLFEDGESGFCICGHVYAKAAHGKAHDHGSSWAIYGQADGITEMTDWKIIDTTKDDKSESVSLVEPIHSYTMKRGDVKLYDIGDVHSPSREKPVKLIRIEGTNLDRIKRSQIKEK